MSCPRPEELVALIDGALPPAALAEARRHADGCDACGAELARLSAGILALQAGAPAAEPSPLFATRLASRLAALPPRRRGLARLVPTWLAFERPGRLALAALAGALVLAAAALLAPRHRGGELSLAAELALAEDYEVVVSVGDVESADDVAVVAALDELGREGRP
jgi:anti-sigma factor RsiW